MTIFKTLLDKNVRVWTIKDNYRLGDDIQSKILAFAFGIAAEIERDMISQRTKEALARKRSEGVVLGRPFGKKSSKVKLTGHEKEIKELFYNHTSKSSIGRIFGVHRMTVDKFMKERISRCGK
jgi:DNA invertase Pin-like site-specific DNA recombinase